MLIIIKNLKTDIMEKTTYKITDSIIKGIEHTLNNALLEDFGVFQVANHEVNNILKNFVDIIYNDIINKSYLNNKINSFLFNSFVISAYKLSYKCPFNWLIRLDVYILFSNDKTIYGEALLDEEQFTLYTNNKILHAGICIYNPEENCFIKNTLYHELKHFYRKSILYKNDQSTLDNDIIVSNKNPHVFNYDISDTKTIINKLNENGVTQYIMLHNFMLECLYYLNYEELYSHLENLYCEFEDACKHNITSFENVCKYSKTYMLYNSIKQIIEFCENNNIYVPDDTYKKIIGNDAYNKILNKDICIFKQAFNDNNIHHNYKFIFKKFNKKLQYFMKHVNKIYKFCICI